MSVRGAASSGAVRARLRWTIVFALVGAALSALGGWAVVHGIRDQRLRSAAESLALRAALVDSAIERAGAETAAALDVSQRTVARDWTMAKAWLVRELIGDAGTVEA